MPWANIEHWDTSLGNSRTTPPLRSITHNGPPTRLQTATPSSLNDVALPKEPATGVVGDAMS